MNTAMIIGAGRYLITLMLLLWVTHLTILLLVETTEAAHGADYGRAQAMADPHQLSRFYYERSCPDIGTIVEHFVRDAVLEDPRMAASLLRMHFHDCFVNGCDGSVLLDDTATMVGEKTSPPNNNSLRGFEVIDKIKAAVEAACPATVSCADILALAANASVRLVGGPSWRVPLGRADARTASFSDVIQYLPSPFESLDNILRKFAVRGLSVKDAVVLSGAHTIGRASCRAFAYRLYNFSSSGRPDPTLDPHHRAFHILYSCPNPVSYSSNCSNISSGYTYSGNLDVTTPDWFDSEYYRNLVHHKGLLQSDQILYSSGGAAPTDYDSDYSYNYIASLVQFYSYNQPTFFKDFSASMIKLGRIPPTFPGEIRKNCRKPN